MKIKILKWYPAAQSIPEMVNQFSDEADMFMIQIPNRRKFGIKYLAREVQKVEEKFGKEIWINGYI